jgi:TPR repeat protein
VDVDSREGMRWLKQACKAKHLQGMYDFANCMYTGEPSDIPGALLVVDIWCTSTQAKTKCHLLLHFLVCLKIRVD